MNGPKKGSRVLVVVGLMCMTVGGWMCYLFVPRFRTDLASSEIADVWSFENLMEEGPGPNRHVHIEGIQYDTSLLAQAKLNGQKLSAFVPVQSANLFNDDVQLLAQLPRFQGRVDVDAEALGAESEVTGVMRRLSELSVTDQFFLISRMPGVDPFETWVIAKDARPMQHSQVWQMLAGLLALAAIGNILVASQPASAVGWLYIFNPLGMALATLAGYPFRNPGKYFRAIGLVSTSVGVGAIAFAFSVAFPDGQSVLPGQWVIMSAIPVAIVGASFVLGGLIRFAFPPLTADRPKKLPSKRLKVSAEILCGN